MKKFLVAGLALLLGGCASIIAGDQQRIAVVTPDVKDAACKLEDGRGGFWYLPRTPGTVIVNKGDGPLEVTCEKEGYKTATATVDSRVFAPGVFGTAGLSAIPGATLAIVGIALVPVAATAIVGLAVDAATGAIAPYPDQVVVAMAPDPGVAAPAPGARPNMASMIAGLKRLGSMRVAVLVAPVRAAPDPLGEVLALVRLDDRVELVGDTPSGWLQVAVQGSPVGWIHWTALNIPRYATRVGSTRL